jgi:ribosomal protein S18 acetylase RimI-like enzyme
MYIYIRTLFPECETFPDICTAVQEAMHQEKLAKKKGPNSQPPKSDSKISLPIAKINNKPNPPKAKQKKISTLVECVQKVANAPTNYNIELPQGATLRLATINDASAIFDLIRELADFEKEPDGVKIDLSTFRNDGWGNPNNPSFWVYVVDIDTTVHIGGTSNTNVPKSNNLSNVITVGMALFFPVYSTWEGKTLHLEDLYVKEAYRNMNIGNSLLKAIAAISVEANLLRTEWQCLNWNRPALNFYEKIGATVYSDWRVLRMNQESVRKYVGVDKSVDDSVSEVINDNSNNGSASDISFVIDRNGSDPNPPAKLSGESANMWCDKFQHAMMVRTNGILQIT